MPVTQKMLEDFAALEALIAGQKVAIEDAKAKMADAEAVQFDAHKWLDRAGESLNENRTAQRDCDLNIADLTSKKRGLQTAEAILMADVENATQAVSSASQGVVVAGLAVNSSQDTVEAIKEQINAAKAALDAAANEPETAVEPEPQVDSVPANELVDAQGVSPVKSETPDKSDAIKSQEDVCDLNQQGEA